MSLINILLIFAIIAIAVVIISQYIKMKKNAEVVQEVDVDDQTYTLEKMIRLS